jgi:hypothetical protein
MPELTTHADSLRMFLTGAGSDGGSQSSDALSLGNYRSSTELVSLGQVITSPISNVTVDFVGYENGTGAGTLTAIDANTLAWTPPGGSQGAGVAIANGESKLLEGANVNQFIRVTRTSATGLTGTATVTLSNVFNNLIGFPNVSSAGATSGGNNYLAGCIKNVASTTVGGVSAFIGTLGTQQLTNTAQLGASGSGTPTTSGSFSDWPLTGFALIKTSGGTERELVYYSSRTSTVLTVPAAGRGLLGTTAAAGASTDTIDAVPGIRIGKEAPSSSHAQTIANIATSPSGITWNRGITAASGLSIGDMAPGDLYFLWLHRLVVAGEIATPSALQKIKLNFDAA